MALTLLIPWGTVFRLGGEFVAGAVAGIEGSVAAGGAIAGGVGAGALGDLGASATAAKIAAAAVRGEGAAARCMNSFTGDTPVLMADGSSKPIAEVKVGDEVANAEPADRLVQRHVVTALHITGDDHDFVDITVQTPVGPRTVRTTAHHPFWNATGQAWTDAADLKTGDLLSTPGAGLVAVDPCVDTLGAISPTTSLSKLFTPTMCSPTVCRCWCTTVDRWSSILGRCRNVLMGT